MRVVWLFVNMTLFASFPNLFTGYFHLGRASLDTRHASEPQNPIILIIILIIILTIILTIIILIIPVLIQFFTNATSVILDLPQQIF